MKSVSINGIARVNLGKTFAKQLRKDDNVPCVIYGGTESPIHFYAHSNEFRKIVYTPEVFLIEIVFEKESIRAIMGDIQFHPVTDKILHIDFVRIFDNQQIRINMPVSIKGNAIGVRNGGRLVLNLRRVLIEGLSENLPESIDIDITQLKIGDVIRVSDLSLDNVLFLNNSNDVVVAVKTARAAIIEEEEEGETEGDVEGGSSEGGSSEGGSSEGGSSEGGSSEGGSSEGGSSEGDSSERAK